MEKEKDEAVRPEGKTTDKREDGISERTMKTLELCLEGHRGLAFVVPANLVTDSDGAGTGLAHLRDRVWAGFACLKIRSLEKGGKRQVLMYRNTAPGREQDLVWFTVSLARGFGQREVFFVDSEGIGHAVCAATDSGGSVGDERFWDGTGPSPGPKKVAAEDVVRYLKSVLGERFVAGSGKGEPSPPPLAFYNDWVADMIREYGFDCVDCICPRIFDEYYDFPAETTEDRISRHLRYHDSVAVLFPKNVARDGDGTRDRFENLTYRAAYGYSNALDRAGEKKAMLVWNDPHVGGDETFLIYTVSAAMAFGEAEMLYVDTKGKGWLVSCAETGSAKVGEKRPYLPDADGVPRKVTEAEILSYMTKKAGEIAEMSKDEQMAVSGVSGMVTASIRMQIRRRGYGCLSSPAEPGSGDEK